MNCPGSELSMESVVFWFVVLGLRCPCSELSMDWVILSVGCPGSEL